MAEIVSAKGTGHKVEQIIQGARTELILISPYLRLDDTYMQELKRALDRKVSVKFVFREEDLKKPESEKLRSLTGLQLFSLPRLHAKCYYNEQRMVITSMNLHESSEVNNREIGVFIDRTEDQRLYADAVEQARSILESAKPLPRHAPEPTYASPLSRTGKGKRSPVGAFIHGFTKGILNGAYCIRCATRIPLNAERPLCDSCYREWAKWKNEDYEEEHCHQCGKERKTTMAKPLCRTCYSKS